MLMIPEKSQFQKEAEASLVAQGMTLAMELAWAFERGVIGDAFMRYSQVLQHLGRRITDAPLVVAIKSRWGTPDNTSKRSVSGDLRLGSRMDVFEFAIAPALRNVLAVDAERHWRFADGVMKRYADLEASAHLHAAAKHRERLFDVDEANTEEADQVMGEINRCEALATFYGRLAQGCGWTK